MDVENARGWRMREEVNREFGIDVYTLLYKARTYSIAQGILLNVMWRPGWEKILGENGYMYGLPWWLR